MYGIAYPQFGMFRPMSGAIAAGALAATGAIISSNASSNAASTQANAANNAAQLQYQLGQQQLGFQQQEWNQEQQNIAPWLQMGGGALGQLGYLMGVTPNTSLGAQTSSVPQLGGTAKNPNYNAGLAQIPQAGQGPSGVSPLGGTIQPPGGAQPLGGAASQAVRVSAPIGGLAAPGSASPATGSASSPIGMRPTGGPAGSIGSPGDTGNPATGGFGSLLSPYGQTFQAPTGLTEQNDPGYQARLQLGLTAMDKSAAARGNVLTGGTLQAENQAAQDYASNEYSNVYNRALQGYDTNYNVWSNDQANEFNRLAAMSGVGQTAAAQLGSLGQSAVNSSGNTLANIGSQVGQQYNNAGAANASGIVGSANAWSGALGSTGNNLSNLYMLSQLGMI